MADDDDIPPLEDMYQCLDHTTKSHLRRITVNELLEGHVSESEHLSKRVNELLEDKTADVKVNSYKEKANYCGFKKGFLTQAESAIVPSVKENDVLFDDVENAMQNINLHSKEWLTADLLTKLSNDPKLAGMLAEPSFHELLALFQSDPAAAMVMVRNNPELGGYMKECCMLLGDHFATLADTRAPVDKEQSVNEAANSEDEARIKGLLSDSLVGGILREKEIQELIICLKNDPGKATRFLQRNTDPSLRRKIQKLIDVGLLQMG